MEALYYPSSFVLNKKEQRPLPIIWFAVERIQPFPFTCSLVQGYDGLPDEVKLRTQLVIQEALTFEEMTELRSYLECNLEFNMLEGRMALPMYPKRSKHIRDGYIIPYSISEESPYHEVYRISDREDYPFNFEIRGCWMMIHLAVQDLKSK